ncbi:MAG: WhiB family transcriptional regulator [Acidothermus sp.]|nr:WhiB family transcriptional regulator [Acidothermus sp.]MCL6537058.1 WhiB family transcriptional regulator [Acidothermus sp.]
MTTEFDAAVLRAYRASQEIPCVQGDPDLFFAESLDEIEAAKALCRRCPVRRECLEAALARREACGVWGGELLENGVVIQHKRPRGRPRKDAA